MKRRAPAAPVGVDKGIPQKVVKQALEIKRAGPYLIGKFHHVYFLQKFSRCYTGRSSTYTWSARLVFEYLLNVVMKFSQKQY